MKEMMKGQTKRNINGDNGWNRKGAGIEMGQRDQGSDKYPMQSQRRNKSRNTKRAS